MRSAPELSERATFELLTPQEVAYVESKLVSSSVFQDPNLAFWIYIVGRLGLIKYRSIIEKCIYYKDNEWVCINALKVLCTYWEYTEDYLEAIKSYIRGVESDETDDIRIYALSIAGTYLKEHFDAELLQLLLDVFEHYGESDKIVEKYDGRGFILKGGAYEALVEAAGYSELPDPEEIEKILENNQLYLLDLVPIERAHQRLNKQNKRK